MSDSNELPLVDPSGRPLYAPKTPSATERVAVVTTVTQKTLLAVATVLTFIGAALGNVDRIIDAIRPPVHRSIMTADTVSAGIDGSGVVTVDAVITNSGDRPGVFRYAELVLIDKDQQIQILQQTQDDWDQLFVIESETLKTFKFVFDLDIAKTSPRTHTVSDLRCTVSIVNFSLNMILIVDRIEL